MHSQTEPASYLAPIALTAGSNDAIAALFSASWARLRSELGPDLDIPTCPSVRRAEAACGREAGRLARGQGDLAELEHRLRAFEVSVLTAIAARDDARSRKVCGHCGDHNVETTAPKLTGARTCMKCAGEATP